MSANKEFKVNEFITLKLERGDLSLESVIYVADERFRQCKYLLLNIPINKISSFDEIDSIDEAASKLDRSQERNEYFKRKIPPEVEFWGHCSNLQMWAEHYYDTRLLHSNLAFPLLKKLAEVGDPIAKRAFREEIAKRLASGFLPVIEFLTEENYLKYLTHEEIVLAMLDLKEAEAVLRIEKIVGKPLEILTELHEEIMGALIVVKNRHVQRLFLQDCNLTSVPKELKSFTKIEGTNLGGNQVSTLPEWISEFRNLKYINANGNKISRIPDWIKYLKNLEYLNLSYNNITKIPEIIGTLKNLKIFYINNCPIETIYKSFPNLPSLEHFDIHDDFLTNNSKKILVKYLEKRKKNKKIK